MSRRLRSLVAAAPFTLALGATSACTSIDAPTAPRLEARSERRATSPSAKPDLVDFSGDWVPVIVFGAPFEDASGLPGRYRCDEGDRPLYSNNLHLDQVGSRIIGTSALGSGLTCFQFSGPGEIPRWQIAIDDAFDGHVHGNEIRFSLNQHLEITATMDPTGQTATGTLRVRVDPPTDPPSGKAVWIDGPFLMYRYPVATATQ
jgi:hypothetical protein